MGLAPAVMKACAAPGVPVVHDQPKHFEFWTGKQQGHGECIVHVTGFVMLTT